MNIYEALWQDDERMSGAVCFRGTRIPVWILFEYVAANQLDDFREGYPDVSQDQISAVLTTSSSLIDALFPKRKTA